MTQIKTDLIQVITKTMIPQVEDYLEELNKILQKNEAKEDDLNTIRDLESFLLELENVVLAINKDKMNDKQASEIYQRIQNLIEESKEK